MRVAKSRQDLCCHENVFFFTFYVRTHDGVIRIFLWIPQVYGVQSYFVFSMLSLAYKKVLTQNSDGRDVNLKVQKKGVRSAT